MSETLLKTLRFFFPAQATARAAKLAFSAANLVPLLHIRCRTTANFLAKATLAFFMPARLASFAT